MQDFVDLGRICLDAALRNVMTKEIDLKKVKFALLGVKIQVGFPHSL
jgi:hypothetical protein